MAVLLLMQHLELADLELAEVLEGLSIQYNETGRVLLLAHISEARQRLPVSAWVRKRARMLCLT